MSDGKLHCLLTFADNIIRVLSTPDSGAVRQTESLITSYKTDPSLKWDVSSDVKNDPQTIVFFINQKLLLCQK